MKPALFRPLLRSLESEVVEVTIEGRKGWRLSSDGSVPRRRASSVRLLPQYDCYVIGSHPRDTITHEAAGTAIRSDKRGQWEGVARGPVPLLDRTASGLWAR